MRRRKRMRKTLGLLLCFAILMAEGAERSVVLADSTATVKTTASTASKDSWETANPTVTERLGGTEGAYTALVGFQTSDYDFRQNFNNDVVQGDKNATVLYDAWLKEQGQEGVPEKYNGFGIYQNGNGPAVTKSGKLNTTRYDTHPVELYRDAEVVDADMTADGEYTVGISNLNLLEEEDADEIFNMLYIGTDIPYSEANKNIKVTASSIKVNGEEIAKDVNLPNKADINTEAQNLCFMIADIYTSWDKTEGCLYYGNPKADPKEDNKLLNVPANPTDIEITFTIEGVDWASIPTATPAPTPTQLAPFPVITPPPVVSIEPFDIYVASNVNSALTPDEGEKGTDGKSIQAAVFASKEIKAKIDAAKSKDGKPLFTEETMLWRETEPNVSSMTISQTGEFSLSVTARGNSKNLTGDGAIWLPLLINGTDSNMPADCNLLGKSITVGEGDAARTYAWPTRLAQDCVGSVRLTVCNQWAMGNLQENSNAVKDVIPVKKGDKISFTFYVIPKKPAVMPTATPAAISTAPATSYNAYLGFQTDNWAFRSWYNDDIYGYNSREIDYKNEIGYWDSVSAYATELARLKVAITDAEMTDNDKEYVVSIKGANLQTLKVKGNKSTAFNMLFVSTDIPLAMKGVTMENATLKIDGNVVKEYTVVPCKGDALDYYQFMLADGYAPADGTKNAVYPRGDLLKVLPTDSIEVSYTIKGVTFKNSGNGNQNTPIPSMPGESTPPETSIPEESTLPMPSMPEESTPPETSMPEESTLPIPSMPGESVPPETSVPEESTLPMPSLPGESVPPETSMPEESTLPMPSMPGEPVPPETSMPGESTLPMPSMPGESVPPETSMPEESTLPMPSMPGESVPPETSMPKVSMLPTTSPDIGDNLRDEEALLARFIVEGLDIITGNAVEKGFLTVPRVQLIWDANSQCDGYEIWRREGGSSYRKVDTVDNVAETEWYDTSVEKGKRYSYRVLGYAKDDNGKILRAKYGDSMSINIRKTVKTCTYTAKRTGRNLKITFKRAEGTKCQIQVKYAGHGKWKNVTCALNKKIVKKVSPKSLKIRIRTCEKVDGRMKYSKWTRTMTVR